MTFATTLFFYQFGFFMMITMVFSFLWTNFFFTPLLVLVGPVAGGGGAKQVSDSVDEKENIMMVAMDNSLKVETL